MGMVPLCNNQSTLNHLFEHELCQLMVHFDPNPKASTLIYSFSKTLAISRSMDILKQGICLHMPINPQSTHQYPNPQNYHRANTSESQSEFSSPSAPSAQSSTDPSPPPNPPSPAHSC
mmetsp:Transcript_27913/g.47450  ORF Transcript_27913/g.47450 Transcript_27913/m.47450 type:complete len:118 (+) Transcript_27913:88-441(+)